MQCHLLGLYAEVCRENPSSNVREVRTNKNCLVPNSDNPRLKQDIHSIFISNCFQARNFTAVPTSGGSFETLKALVHSTGRPVRLRSDAVCV